jgi:2-polyprenyl-3-methyl-5-hydroxy-6-metoxy-1,4-benzoquinol methylase
MKSADLHPCAYCGHDESTRLYRTWSTSGDDYWIHHCSSCRAFFLVPGPTPEVLSKAYGADYYGFGEKKFAGLTEKAVGMFRNARARLVSGYLPPGARVLDIGCGNGHFLRALLKYGSYELHGLEIPGPAAQRTAEIAEINLKIGAIADGDYEKGSFDGITLFHVFEHLTDPRRTLEIISSLLKDGGILALSFPNIVSIQSRIFKGAWFHLDPPRHTQFFAPTDFINLMDDMGFKKIRETYFSPEQNPMGAMQSLLNCLVKKRELLYESLKGTTGYTKEYSRSFLFLQKCLAIAMLPILVLIDAAESLLRKGATVEFIFKKIPPMKRS